MIANLLYRGFPIRMLAWCSIVCPLEAGDTGEGKPELQKEKCAVAADHCILSLAVRALLS
jgi:hypothetical protein